MRPYSSLGLANYRPHRHDVMQTIRDHRFSASQYLVADGRRQWFIAEAERDRLVRRAGCRPAGLASTLVPVRQVLGAALVRIGARLAATAPTRGPVPAVGGSESRR